MTVGLFDPYSGFPAALLSRIIRRRLDMTIDHHYIRILPLPICKVHHGYRNAAK